MKPGDLIEWYYSTPSLKSMPVVKHESMLSTVTERWVPIDGVYTLVSIADDIMTWFHPSKGLVSARTYDHESRGVSITRGFVRPRVCDVTS